MQAHPQARFWGDCECPEWQCTHLSPLHLTIMKIRPRVAAPATSAISNIIDSFIITHPILNIPKLGINSNPWNKMDFELSLGMVIRGAVKCLMKILWNNIQMFKSLLFLGLLILGTCFTEQEGVLVLTQADFALAVKQHDYLFVKFYTPWCGHCKKLAPVWIELASELKTVLPNVRLAEIDLETSKDLQTQLKIQSYPTLLFFKNGVPINFGGSRTKQFMTSWLAKKIQEPIVIIPQSTLPSLENDGNVNIVFYGHAESQQYNVLLSLAKNDDYNMYYRVQGTSKPSGSVEIFRPFGAPLLLEKVDYNLRSWINLNDRPLVLDYDDRTTKELYTEKRNGIILFVAAGEHGENLLAAFKQAAVEWKIVQKKRLIFTQISATTDNEPYIGFSDYIKVNPVTHPIVYVKTAEKQKFIYNGKIAEVTSAKIIEFIKNVESGKVRKWKMDEETKPKQAQTKQENAQAQPTPTAEL